MSEITNIGFVGDGQLGRMMAEAAIPMGYHVWALGKAGVQSPAAQIKGVHEIDGDLTDPAAIHRLAEAVGRDGVLSWEIEHIDSGTLQELAEDGYNIQPSPFSLEAIQNKLTQKLHLESHSLPTAPFAWLDDGTDFADALAEFGGELMIKTKTGGYDGRGNLKFDDQMTWAAIKQHFTKDGRRPGLYGEKLIPFQRELAVVGARDMSGRIALYPVVETVHQNNICHMVFSPADIDPRVKRDAEELGRETIQSFRGAGVFAVEMFQATDDQLLVNEVAPRVHNSGHLTDKASQTSQFEQHIRAITGRQLGGTKQISPAAAMINILGTREGTIDEAAILALKTDQIFPRLYGKSPRPARKIGHVTVLAETAEEARSLAIATRAQIDA